MRASPARALVALIVLASMPAGGSARAQEDDDRRSYRLLRDDENWAWLRKPHAEDDFWDPLKYLRLWGQDDVYLTVGGEIREWVEGYQNELWGQTGVATNIYWLQRYMAHADAHVSPYTRLFVQLKSGIEYGRSGGPRPIDEDRLDFNQLYADGIFVPGATLDAEPKALLRVGRQEMSYGSGRLIDVREGPNVRFGYDGARLITRFDPIRFDAFAVRPDLTQQNVFGDTSNPQQAFWGTWGTYSTSALLVDAYYLGLERDEFRYQRAAGKEVRHTVGARGRVLSSFIEGEVEAAGQFGQVGSLPIAAWTVAAEVVANGRRWPLEPKLTLGIGATSGDKGTSSGTLGTFSPLFPRGAYFGLVQANGPSNNVAPHAALAVKLPLRLSASVEYWAFWRESLADGVYNVPGNLLRPGNASEGSFLGSQVEGFLTWQADRHLSLNATLAYFATGSFFDTSAPSRNITYGASWATYKF
jgi:alginate export protein